MIDYPINILVPLDFSDGSLNALRYGTQLAKDLNSNVEVLHVYHPVSPSDGINYSDRLAYSDQYEECISEKFEALSKQIPDLEDVKVELKVKMGFLKDELAQITENDKNYLIVMGAAGAGDSKRYLFGSNALTLIDEINCPVITIPEGNISLPIRYIGYATDLSLLKNTDDLRILKRLSSLYHAKVYLVNINEKPSEMDIEHSIEALCLHDYFKDFNHEFCFLPDDKVDHGIELFVEKFNIDMLVMRPADHNWLGKLFNSHTRKAMAYNQVPLMAIHK